MNSAITTATSVTRCAAGLILAASSYLLIIIITTVGSQIPFHILVF